MLRRRGGRKRRSKGHGEDGLRGVASSDPSRQMRTSCGRCCDLGHHRFCDELTLDREFGRLPRRRKKDRPPLRRRRCRERRLHRTDDTGKRARSVEAPSYARQHDGRSRLLAFPLLLRQQDRSLSRPIPPVSCSSSSTVVPRPRSPQSRPPSTRRTASPVLSSTIPASLTSERALGAHREKRGSH